MKLKLVLLTLVAALVPMTALAATASAKTRGVHYVFTGPLLSAPSSGSLSLEVQGGNRIALQKMLGQSVNQTFSYDASTEFLLWQHGLPKVVAASDLKQGDWVRVNIRAPRVASLSDVEHVAPGIVGDHVTEPTRPDKPLYLFRGKLTALGASTVTVDVRNGNRRATRLLIGQAAQQTFAFNSDTIVVLWQGKVPTVISASQLKVGDTIVVRVRADAHSSLPEVEATAAKRLAEHEPPAVSATS